ncbi:hypothetical protein [Campylobacter iguaniorum]
MKQGGNTGENQKIECKFILVGFETSHSTFDRAIDIKCKFILVGFETCL